MKLSQDPPSALLSVVIPVYKRCESVMFLLDDIFRQDYSNFEVIVVEDCGNDGTYEAIANRFPQVVLLQNSRNLGPAVSRNRGIIEAQGAIIVGFDSDVTIPDRHILSKIASTFVELPETSGVALHLLTPDGQSEDRPRWWHPVPIGDFANKRFFTSYFSGTAYAFRRDVLVTAGLFPEILYMYYEEVELALRILDLMGSIVYCPNLVVLHHASIVARRNDVRDFYTPRNQILLAAACFPILQALFYLGLRLPYQFLKACGRRNPFSFLGGVFSAIRLVPTRLRERRPIRSATIRQISSLRQGLLV